MKRPPTKQKSFKSYLEALNSSLKNAVAACRAEDTGPGMVTLGQTDSWGVGFVRGLRFHVVADARHCGCLGSGKSGLGNSVCLVSGAGLAYPNKPTTHIILIHQNRLFFPFKTNFICISNS